MGSDGKPAVIGFEDNGAVALGDHRRFPVRPGRYTLEQAEGNTMDSACRSIHEQGGFGCEDAGLQAIAACELDALMRLDGSLESRLLIVQRANGAPLPKQDFSQYVVRFGDKRP